MKLSVQKIVLISSGQPSLNPRLVKEADALAAAGYQVTVLYAYWNDWGTQHDRQLLAGKNWKAIRLGGDPDEKRGAWFLSRMINKISRYMLQKTHSYTYFADTAIARSSYFLIKGAKKYKADLYIAHNLGALPAAIKTAAIYKKPCGFDAEDFHRHETTGDVNSFHYKICSYLEDKYLPGVSYITASSPLIAQSYAALYKREVVTLLNVFPRTAAFGATESKSEPLKLFWFSQTIGPNRGLEMIIEAMALTKTRVELHLLGQLAAGYDRQLSEAAENSGAGKNSLHFMEPVPGDTLFTIAAGFDIGLASETGFCPNNNMALSNKIFTYIQSGLAVAASDTPAQKALIGQFPLTGKIYSSALQLSAILNEYNANRRLLWQTKKDAFNLGQTRLNWENEQQTFLGVVKNVLTKNEEHILH